MTMTKITFTDTTVVKEPYVKINGTEYKVKSENEGGTDLNASTFNTLQTNIENYVDSKTGDLSDVATSGDYNDLINKPAIPTVNDTLTSTSTTDALSSNQGNVLNNKIEKLEKYSTDEVDTGKKWIDGKTIYRKTIVGTSKITQGSTIDHNVSNIGEYRTVINACFYSNNNVWNQTYANQNSFVFVDAINSTNISFNIGTSWSNLFIPKITIEYTKTS